jgi:hypothetical protein
LYGLYVLLGVNAFEERMEHERFSETSGPEQRHKSQTLLYTMQDGV